MDETKEIEEKLDLAIMANGGEDFIKYWCFCDPPVSVGPCEYCAVRNGLIAAKQLISHIKELEEGIKGIPLYEYGEALGEGCDASGAWSCFCEALHIHFEKVLDEKGGGR